MYRVRQDGSLKTQNEIIAMYPNISFPKIWNTELIEYLKLDPVFESPTPSTTRYQTLFKNEVEQIGDKWMWKWSITEMSDDEKKLKDAEQANFVRNSRNVLIFKSDWTQLTDAPLTNEQKNLWAIYRQSLRDIPQQSGFPWEVEWPQKPE